MNIFGSHFYLSTYVASKTTLHIPVFFFLLWSVLEVVIFNVSSLWSVFYLNFISDFINSHNSSQGTKKNIMALAFLAFI
jgi:hypothetical protein